MSSKLAYLLFSLTVFFCRFNVAQNLNITLCPLYQDGLENSMICVSSADGKSLFEHVLTQHEIYDGSAYQLTIPDPGHYCLSIINKYTIDSINNGAPFYWSKTYYDQSNDLHILKFDHPSLSVHKKDIVGKVSITNAPPIEHWQYFTNATVTSFNQKGTSVFAQTDFEPDEDLFIVMKSRNDSRYRYIYIPQSEIPISNYVVSPFNALQYDWKFLRTDLNHVSVPMPFTSPFTGWINAVNSNTGNVCMLTNHKGGIYNKKINEEILSKYNTQAPFIKADDGSLDIFLPNEPLLDYNANLTWKNELYTYNYRITHGNKLEFPFYPESYFTPEFLINDSLGLRTTMNGLPDIFRIFYRRRSLDEMPQAGMKLHQLFKSTWIVVGKNQGDINFNIPAISEQNKLLFPGADEWVYERFENVKFLEKDPQIDWINFFHDYNVLIVSYYDPLK